MLLRDPSKLPAELHEKVEIMQGNAVNAEDVDKVISGVDGVIVVLGTRNQLGKMEPQIIKVNGNIYCSLTSLFFVLFRTNHRNVQRHGKHCRFNEKVQH